MAGAFFQLTKVRFQGAPRRPAIRLFSGSGTATASTFYWGQAAGVIGNLTDCIRVQNAAPSPGDSSVWGTARMQLSAEGTDDPAGRAARYGYSVLQTRSDRGRVSGVLENLHRRNARSSRLRS